MSQGTFYIQYNKKVTLKFKRPLPNLDVEAISKEGALKGPYEV